MLAITLPPADAELLENTGSDVATGSAELVVLDAAAAKTNATPDGLADDAGLVLVALIDGKTNGGVDEVVTTLLVVVELVVGGGGGGVEVVLVVVGTGAGGVLEEVTAGLTTA